MIKSIGKLTLVTILAAVVMGVPMGASAQDKTTPAPAAPAPEAKARAFPFQGKVSAVDKVAMTLSVERKSTNSVFGITSATKLMKAGKPATLADVTVGDKVTGQCTKTGDGKYIAKTVYIGGKPKEPAAAPATPAPPK